MVIINAGSKNSPKNLFITAVLPTLLSPINTTFSVKDMANFLVYLLNKEIYSAPHQCREAHIAVQCVCHFLVQQSHYRFLENFIEIRDQHSQKMISNSIIASYILTDYSISRLQENRKKLDWWTSILTNKTVWTVLNFRIY